jgi:hypothetical protein
MFEAVFQSFEKLISEFSWRRLVFLVILLLMVATAIWLWESNTGQMRLTRIERTISILNSIKDLQEHPVMKSDSTLQSTLSALKDDLKKFTERKSQPPFWSLINITWQKAFAGGFLWLLFSLIYFSSLRTKKQSDFHALIGCLFLAVVFGCIGALLPDFIFPWLNFIAYPVANFILVVALSLWWQARKKDRIASQSNEG